MLLGTDSIALKTQTYRQPLAHGTQMYLKPIRYKEKVTEISPKNTELRENTILKN